MNIQHALSNQIVAAQELLRNLKDVIGDDSGLIHDTLEGETSLFEAIEAAARQIATDSVLIKGIDSHVKEVTNRKTRLKKRLENVRAAILSAMETAGEKSIDTPVGKLTRREIGWKLIITDEVEIPSEFFEPQPPRLMKKPILEALKERQAAIEDASQIKDSAKRKSALAEIDKLYPQIPSAELSNAGETLSFFQG